MSSRRTFIRTLAVAAAATLVHSGAARAVASVLRSRRTLTNSPSSCATFASLEGATFRVTGQGSEPQYWQLVRVQEHQRGAQVENFSLTFAGPSESPLPQGIYQLAHPELGETELFVVAAPIDDRTFGYEAVINRLV